MKKIFVICNNIGPEKDRFENYAERLKSDGYEVYLPTKDPKLDEYGICNEDTKKIAGCHEVHIFYDPDNKLIHFYLGVTFAYGRKIILAEHKSSRGFPNMLTQWAKIYQK